MLSKIAGKTKVFGVVADPITHVRAPEVFNKIFKQNKIDAVCVPFHICNEDILSFISICKKWKNLSGIFVTIPHKEIIATACDTLNKEAELIGAVNVIRPEKNGGWRGAMYDGSGFVNAMKQHSFNFNNKNVAIFGAGGAATAIVSALIKENIENITIVNRNIDRAVNVKTKMVKSQGSKVANKIHVVKASEIHYDYDLIINATPLGLDANDALPIPTEIINNKVFVAEIIMKPHNTKLISYAEKVGCKVFRGAAMFDSQVELIRKFFSI